VERKDSVNWVSGCRSFEVNGVRDRNRGRKTWNECVKKDLVELDLHQDWALDRVRWWGLICRNRPRRTNMDNGR